MAHNLDELIKHQPPMRLIDELCWAEPGKGHCQLTVSSDNLFYSERYQGLPAHVGIELMAQSIAAIAGYQHKAEGGEIKLGFLLGSRKYQCDVDSFKLGEQYDVFVEELHAESSGLSVFECDIRHCSEVVAKARLNVYQPPDESAFIEENYG
ncbi:hotdog family protein [Idiomarina sp. HP20-50]|uniref:hotdog family protein n=1 Tax=Idiomarina sp. HP20-50 TaxID=3070813 RepID=UPI00294ABA40|nr:hotdog family protein [Idiomarina sp. HP20-50]MDV6316390.1 hotdog family protein [Idiomarina sp. HP20-50]